MLAQEIIRIERDGAALSLAPIDAFVGGLVDGAWSEGQVAALALARSIVQVARGSAALLDPHGDGRPWPALGRSVPNSSTTVPPASCRAIWGS
jgi:hypothetical protein